MAFHKRRLGRIRSLIIGIFAAGCLSCGVQSPVSGAPALDAGSAGGIDESPLSAVPPEQSPISVAPNPAPTSTLISSIDRLIGFTSNRIFSIPVGGTSLQTDSTLAQVNGLFLANNGAYYKGSSIQATNGKFYGLTTFGGTSGNGVLFEYASETNSYQVRYEFNSTVEDGTNPYGSLVQASNGKLYGVTYTGGHQGRGVLFSYDLTTAIYTIEWIFNDPTGAHPHGSLIQGADGMLYGLTYLGGKNGQGVLFQFDPSTSAYTDKYDFDGTNGASPRGSLILGADGNFYGLTTVGGANNLGVLFQYNSAASIYQNKHDFDGTHGANPQDSLFLASDGNFYGLTAAGGTHNSGVLFQFNLASFQVMYVFTDEVPQGSLIEIAAGH